MPASMHCYRHAAAHPRWWVRRERDRHTGGGPCQGCGRYAPSGPYEGVALVVDDDERTRFWCDATACAHTAWAQHLSRLERATCVCPPPYTPQYGDRRGLTPVEHAVGRALLDVLDQRAECPEKYDTVESVAAPWRDGNADVFWRAVARLAEEEGQLNAGVPAPFRASLAVRHADGNAWEATAESLLWAAVTAALGQGWTATEVAAHYGRAPVGA